MSSEKKALRIAARPHIQALQAYTPGEQPQGTGWVKLNTNENPYPPSPRVNEAVQAELENLRKYPEPTSARLRTAIAQGYGLEPNQVIIGNGSDNILDLITRCYAGSMGVGHTVPSYSLYPVVAGMSGRQLIEIPFNENLQLDLEAISACPAEVFFLTTPNAPTGVAFSLEQIEAVLQRIQGLLVVDEAYVDFGGETALPLLARYKNLVVVRTFSKSYGLAGMRVGFALADAGIIEILDRVRDAYNVDRIAQAAALAAFEDVEYFENQRQRVIATREHTRAALEALGWFSYPSAANFLFTQPIAPDGRRGAQVARSLFDHLTANKILVRYFPKQPVTCAFIRVSIGTDSEMEQFLNSVHTWLKHA